METDRAIGGLDLACVISGTVLLLLASIPAYGGSSSTPCIPGNDAWISGVQLGSTPKAVKRLLGKPVRREVGGGEDDGGPYEEIKLSYPRFDVFLVRGAVDRVVTTHQDACTAGGICPGMTRDQVREVLAGVSPVWESSTSMSMYLCEEDHFHSDYYLNIDFTTEGRVAELELVLDRP